MERYATTLGLFPLPEGPRERLADLKGHQKGDLLDGSRPAALETVYDETRERLVADQREADLDVHVEGQARWDDMLAHPLTLAEGVDPGGIVRYYDHNNFHRDPVVVDDLVASGDVATDLERAAALTDSLAAVLPGPWTLAALATDEHYGDQAELLAACAELLADELAAAPTPEVLLLPDPALVTEPPGVDAGERAREALDTVAAATAAETVVAPFYGVPDEATYAHLLDADVGVGYDLVADHEGAVELAGEYGTTDTVQLGVVDGSHSAVEDAAVVRERADWFTDQVPDVSVPKEAYLTPSTELFYLPVERYRGKLRALGAATTTPEVEV